MTDNTLTIKEAYHPNGKIKSRICKNAQGQHHNPHGPAIQYWYENGQPHYQAFWLNGVRHNPAGPAVECWYNNGQPDYQRFWLNGEYLTEAEWKAKTCAKPVPVVLIDGVRYVPES